MEELKTEVQMVPITAYESLSTRLFRVIKWLIMGWAISVIALGLVIVMSLSYTEQTVEEVTTTETVTQDGGDGGSNHYIGGDLNGNANYNENGQDDQSDN